VVAVTIKGLVVLALQVKAMLVETELGYILAVVAAAQAQSAVMALVLLLALVVSA
jgi:hypothetical protein